MEKSKIMAEAKKKDGMNIKNVFTGTEVQFITAEYLEDFYAFDITNDGLTHKNNGSITAATPEEAALMKEVIINALNGRNELLEALQGAMRIVDLWAPKYSKREIEESDIGEIAALAMMRQSFEQAINAFNK